MLKFIKDNYLVILIFALGFVLRIYDLSAESLWYDESFSAMISKKGVLDLINSVLGNSEESNPPLYYVLLHFWVLAFGDSEFSLRFPSVIFGSASIIAVYVLGKLLFNKRAGIVAALIIAVSVFHIQYSQEARAYALMALLSVIFFYSLIKLTAGRRMYYNVLYLVSGILMIYTHYYGLFIIVAQNVFCLTLFLKQRKAGEITIKQWIFLQLILVFSFMPGFMHILKMNAAMQESFWIKEPTLILLYYNMVRYSGSLYLLVLFVLFALVAIIGIRRMSNIPGINKVFKAHEDDNPEPGISSGYRVYLLILWFSVPILIPFIYSIVSTPMFVARYALSPILAYYLLASKGIDSLSSRWAVLVIGIVLLILPTANLKTYYDNVTKPQWREVVSEIENSAGYGDVLVLQPGQGYISVKYYQTRDDITIVPLSDKFPAFKNLGNKRVWVVMRANPKHRKYIKEGLSGTYDFELEKHFAHLDLFRLKHK